LTGGKINVRNIKKLIMVFQRVGSFGSHCMGIHFERGGKCPGECGSVNEEGEGRRRKLHSGKPHNFIHNKTNSLFRQ
jgi:hypothetical protein